MKTRLFCLYLFIYLMLVAACTKEKEPASNATRKVGHFLLADTIIIGYQTTLTDETNNLSLTFDSVLNESRCPIGVECIWQGNVRVKLTFMNGDLKYPFILDSHCQPDTIVGGYKFQFLDATPYPVYLKQVDDSEYQVKLVMTD